MSALPDQRYRDARRADDSIQGTGPLYLHWAADSKSFVTVEHISKGSYGKVVYLADDRWLSVEVKPSFKGKMADKVINSCNWNRIAFTTNSRSKSYPRTGRLSIIRSVILR